MSLNFKKGQKVTSIKNFIFPVIATEFRKFIDLLTEQYVVKRMLLRRRGALTEITAMTAFF